MIPQIYASTLWGKNWIEVIPQHRKETYQQFAVICHIVCTYMWKFIYFSDRIPIRILEEFLKNSAIICKIPIREIEKHQITTLVIDVFQLLQSEFWRREQKSLKIPTRVLIGIPLEKQRNLPTGYSKSKCFFNLLFQQSS